MSLGVKYAMIVEFTGEVLDAVGSAPLLAHARGDFRAACRRDPQVVVVFDHTVSQRVHRDNMYDRYAVRTDAMVIRSQLAITV